MTSPLSSISQAREQFLTLVEAVRPELHQYSARLTGSIIDGEDIVQDTLAKAFFALSQLNELPSLRPWLFRIAHHAALDFLRRRHRTSAEEPMEPEQLADVAGFDERGDPAVTRAALGRFLALPLSQRSAVILKDVLGQSLKETATTLGTTVMAVKALLVRGRANLARPESADTTIGGAALEDLNRYAALFNARDWEGVRALVSEECRLDLVAKSQRRGKQVASYFERYAGERVTLRPVSLEGRNVLAAYVGDSQTAAYFVLVEFEGGRVTSIRDFRYVPYITRDATFRPFDPAE